MTKWYEQAYLLTLSYSRTRLRNYTRANRYNSRECCSADHAIRELLDRFEEPYVDDPMETLYDFYRELNVWGCKAAQKGETEIADIFLVGANVIRDLGDYISAPLTSGTKGDSV